MVGIETRLWAVATLFALLPLQACPRNEPRAAAAEEAGATAAPKIDTSFLLRTFGAGAALANRPLLEDVDPRPGTEALVAIHRGGIDFQVAVVTGDRRILSRAPLGGKVLAHASINFVGEFRRSDLVPGAKTYLMPVETTVYHRSVCGILAFRYRREALSVVGEFSCACWRKEAGGDGSDPFSYMKVSGQAAEVRVEMREERGEKRTYRWDTSESAFVSLSTASH